MCHKTAAKKESRIQVVAAALIFRDQVLVAKRKGSAQESQARWEFPGGKLEAGESLGQALQRELQEELNIQIQLSQAFMSTTGLTRQGKEIRLTLLICEIQDQRLDVLEHEEVRWVSVDELQAVPFLSTNLSFVAPLQNWLKIKRSRETQ